MLYIIVNNNINVIDVFLHFCYLLITIIKNWYHILKNKDVPMQIIRFVINQCKVFTDFIFTLYKMREVLIQLTKRDFISKYIASYIGIYWAFLQPFISIFVMWFVFTFGFKPGNIESSVPFIAWLVCGMIPWFFISEAINSATRSLIDYSYLITKVNFRSSIIPIIKILTALFLHGMFIPLIMIFSVGYGFYPSIHWLQIPYYLFAALMLIMGITWFTSAVTVFLRDMEQMISVGMQLAFWATPIFWNHTMLSGKLSYIAYLNPFFYIINGYRDTFIYRKWFFEHLALTIYFWVVTFFFFIFGSLVFSRLKPHFSDVL